MQQIGKLRRMRRLLGITGPHDIYRSRLNKRGGHQRLDPSGCENNFDAWFLFLTGLLCVSTASAHESHTRHSDKRFLLQKCS
jgi:hypothetical protein